MATTTLAFGNNTLLGMTYAPAAAPAAATRASFQALPTVSYTGTGSSFTATIAIGRNTLGGADPSGVVYLTSLGSSGQATTSGGAVSAGYSFGFGTTVTFTASSSADLVSFLRGIYVGDTAPTSASDTFRVSLKFDDNAGNIKSTAIYYDVACYLRGTGIATAGGEIAVEDLRIGDLVRTADGGLKPVKFIGLQSFEAEFIAATPSQRPVLIRQGAIAEGQPARDLSVSPLHGIYLDEVLVPAVALVNGVSVVRGDGAEGVEYFHIELDEHQIILAEGLPAESFIDDDSRAVFDNAYEYEARYGEGQRIERVAPLVDGGFELEAIRRRVAARAGVGFDAVAPTATVGHVERLRDGRLEGWVMDQAEGAAAVELEVLVDGEAVGRTLANHYRTDLDHAGLAGGRCGFRMTLPQAVTDLDRVQVRVVATGSRLRKPTRAAAAA